VLKSALKFSHELLAEVVEPGDFVIDATMGRGNDTFKTGTASGRKRASFGF
jgi:hypothetical protein